MTKLFSNIEFKGISLKNRIVMSPMCMYSCMNEDGKITSFHFTHYTSRAVGQVGLIMTEATAVQPEGRISARDLGIWDDIHIEGMKELNEQLHDYGAKTGIQLAHAGRKAELIGNIYAPSPVPFNNSSKQPVEMTEADIQSVVHAFKNAARRAKEADFDFIEIHGAHGYLINQFLSPLINRRNDCYGGNRQNRFRFLKEVVEAVHSEWNNNPLFVRLSTDEYHEAGNSLEDIIYFAKILKELRVDVIDASSGGVVPTSIRAYPGYQVRRCEAIKHDAPIATGAVGLITTGLQAEEILQNNRADLIFIGRALLKNPYWAKTAANELGYKLESIEQYQRGWK